MSHTSIERVDTIHEGWGRFLMLHLRTEDGARFTRQVEDHGDAACVLPYDPARRCVMLVRQPRAPLLFKGEGESLWEAPAGILDEPDAAACARREALEEAGLRLDALEPLGAFWPMPGTATERIHLFLAPYGAADRIAEGGGLADENEAIELSEMGFAEAFAAADAGRIADLKTWALLQALRLRHPELIRPGAG
ncbi:MAG: NUDIX hydrolase [Methylobacterium mesophilicum]|nr:NUDIX hydrolase [Methylobacterium mesophilicum]